MLEKKKGVRKIYTLHIIRLLEADFQTALRYFFAVQMQSAMELNELLDEQHGLKKNRSAIDAAMVAPFIIQA